mmetsp:Transcript_40722/g.86701  ORF Transcript_40722/g.86701 Transcript_40722/m.86701 type:complete len:210 (-) Transcript_40722:2049-2678(-)
MGHGLLNGLLLKAGRSASQVLMHAAPSRFGLGPLEPQLAVVLQVQVPGRCFAPKLLAPATPSLLGLGPLLAPTGKSRLAIKHHGPRDRCGCGVTPTANMFATPGLLRMGPAPRPLTESSMAIIRLPRRRRYHEPRNAAAALALAAVYPLIIGPRFLKVAFMTRAAIKGPVGRQLCWCYGTTESSLLAAPDAFFLGPRLGVVVEAIVVRL